MKKNILFLIAIVYSVSGNAQAPNWLWAKSAGGTNGEAGYDISTDAGGNVIVTGSFLSASITFGTTVLTNAGSYDIFVVKYDASGNVLWAKSAGGTYNDQGYGISTDAGGNVFVTGSFNSPSITFGTTVLTNAGDYDIFIVKYDVSGNVLWAKSAGGTNDDGSGSISTDDSGNVLVTGRFYGSSITFGTTVLTNTGVNSSDIFIVKYDASGNVFWAKSAGGTNDDGIGSIATDAGGNVLVTGYFWSSSITFGTTVLTNAGNFDIFVVKYDASGNALWAKSAGGTSGDGGKGVSTDAGGNVFATGNFNSPSITFGTTVLTNASGSDIFVVKYDASGNVLWVKSAGGTSGNVGNSISTDAGGNVLVTGFFAGSITFGTTVLTNAGSADILVVKYDASGNVLWAKSTGGTSPDIGYGISTDASGNVLVTGYFSSPSITFGTTVLTNAGYADMFVAKTGNLTGIAEENYSLNSITIFPSPASEYAVISGQFAAGDKIRLTDVFGRTVFTKTFSAPTLNLKLQTLNFSPGIYFVEIITAKEKAVRKLVKQ